MAVATPSPSETDGVFAAVKEADDAHLMRTYGRLPVCFVRGKGVTLWDTDGKEYLDFLGGIAVNGLGHCHPAVVAAIQKQAETLIHTSNLYYTAPQAELAAKLCSISEFDRVFFCNSGAEANEAALKIARKAGKQFFAEKTRIITAEGSFHGRTMATVTATAQAKYQDPFRPLLPDVTYVPRNDVDALNAAVDDRVCAILLEPIQGESGVWPMSPELLQAARALADKCGALLIFDEIQTGMARTGNWWAYEGYGVVPDIMTLAKSLGGGVPIGACLARRRAADILTPGDHGSTFAANPLVSSAALATIEAIENEGLLDNARRMGDYFTSALRDSKAGKGLTDIRGKGLMIGATLAEPKARAVMLDALAKGLIINAIGDNLLRFLPPLIVTEADIDRAVAVLSDVI
jgi:predicted acetylornithine/succinylornithine family transaminase